MGLSFSGSAADYVFTEKFIKDLHRQMFDQIWGWAGRFRQSNKNIGVDKSLISVEIKKLLDDCRYWLDNKTFLAEEIAIRFKHRLVSIHPFANGNGRHARLLADIIMEKVFKKQAFSWGGADLNSTSRSRSQYIQAVRQADEGNYEPLLKFAQS